MQFTRLATSSPALDPKLQWLFFSPQTNAFITGDDRQAFSIPLSSPSAPIPLQPARPFENHIPPPHPCNLPIPDSLYTEFAATPHHGLHFLDPATCQLPLGKKGPLDGDILRSLVFGPDYPTLLFHPLTGALLTLRGRSMELFSRSDTTLTSIAKTKPRGKSVLAYAAHPTEPLLVYGDNYGDFHAHRFTPTTFEKATKIAAKQRNASRIEFSQNGNLLLLAGMGYLSAFRYAAGKFEQLHELSTAVRDFLTTPDASLLLVNKGLHGLAAFTYSPTTGFTQLASLEAPINQLAKSPDNQFLAFTHQDSPTIQIHAITP
jgi:hypothetical protein